MVSIWVPVAMSIALVASNVQLQRRINWWYQQTQRALDIGREATAEAEQLKTERTELKRQLVACIGWLGAEKHG